MGYQNIFQQVTDFCVPYAAIFQLTVVLSCSSPQRDAPSWAVVVTGLGKSTPGGIASSSLCHERLSFALVQVTKGKHQGMMLPLSGGMVQSSRPLTVAELTSLSPGCLAPISIPDTSSRYGGIRLTDPITCPNPPLAGVGLAQPTASPPEAGDFAGQ